MTNDSHVIAAPYRVSQCDQVIEISAKILTDYNDFTKKEDAFFTLSLLMVNRFSKKDSGSLKTSISLDKITVAPQIIVGSVSCINFSDGIKEFAMCLPDKDTANKVIRSYTDFMRCRLGDNLKNTPAATMQKILRGSCMGLEVNFDLEKYGGDVNKAKAALSSAIQIAMKNVSANLKGSVVTSPPKPTDAQKILSGKQ